MRSPLLCSLLLALPALAEGTAPIQAPPAPVESPHVELGLSVGYAYGLGHETRDALMGDLTFGVVPIELSVSYLLGEHFALGAYGSWGPMFANSCPPSVSCHGSSLRFGLRARYRFGESANFTPWLALGSGYERLSQTDDYQGTEVDSGVSGFELLQLQLGAEHRVSSALAVGPFVTGSLGMFFTREFAGDASAIDGRTIHYWVAAGLRGSFWF